MALSVLFMLAVMPTSFLIIEGSLFRTEFTVTRLTEGEVGILSAFIINLPMWEVSAVFVLPESNLVFVSRVDLLQL